MNFSWKEGNAGGYRRRRSLDPLWTDSATADARDMRAFSVLVSHYPMFVCGLITYTKTLRYVTFV